MNQNKRSTTLFVLVGLCCVGVFVFVTSVFSEVTKHDLPLANCKGDWKYIDSLVSSTGAALVAPNSSLDCTFDASKVAATEGFVSEFYVTVSYDQKANIPEKNVVDNIAETAPQAAPTNATSTPSTAHTPETKTSSTVVDTVSSSTTATTSSMSVVSTTATIDTFLDGKAQIIVETTVSSTLSDDDTATKTELKEILGDIIEDVNDITPTTTVEQTSPSSTIDDILDGGALIVMPEQEETEISKEEVLKEVLGEVIELLEAAEVEEEVVPTPVEIVPEPEEVQEVVPEIVEEVVSPEPIEEAVEVSLLMRTWNRLTQSLRPQIAHAISSSTQVISESEEAVSENSEPEEVENSKETVLELETAATSTESTTEKESELPIIKETTPTTTVADIATSTSPAPSTSTEPITSVSSTKSIDAPASVSSTPKEVESKTESTEVTTPPSTSTSSARITTSSLKKEANSKDTDTKAPPIVFPPFGLDYTFDREVWHEVVDVNAADGTITYRVVFSEPVPVATMKNFAIALYPSLSFDYDRYSIYVTDISFVPTIDIKTPRDRLYEDMTEVLSAAPKEVVEYTGSYTFALPSKTFDNEIGSSAAEVWMLWALDATTDMKQGDVNSETLDEERLTYFKNLALLVPEPTSVEDTVFTEQIVVPAAVPTQATTVSTTISTQSQKVGSSIASSTVTIDDVLEGDGQLLIGSSTFQFEEIQDEMPSRAPAPASIDDILNGNSAIIIETEVDTSSDETTTEPLEVLSLLERTREWIVPTVRAETLSTLTPILDAKAKTTDKNMYSLRDMFSHNAVGVQLQNDDGEYIVIDNIISLSAEGMKFKFDASQLKRGAHTVTVSVYHSDIQEWRAVYEYEFFVLGELIDQKAGPTLEGGVAVSSEVTSFTLESDATITTGDVSISFPAQTNLLLTTDVIANDTTIRAAQIASADLIDFNEDTTVFAIEFGIADVPVQFAEPVQISATIDASKHASTKYVDIIVRHERETEIDYQAVSIDPEAVCDETGQISNPTSRVPVIDGTITYYTCKTSTHIGVTVTNGILLWYDAQDIDADGSANSAYTNGDDVVTWSDRSGNGHDMTQISAGAASPTYDATGLNTYPSVAMTNTDRGLQVTGIGATASDWTHFYVMDATQSAILSTYDGIDLVLLADGDSSNPPHGPWNGAYYDGAFAGTDPNIGAGATVLSYIFEDAATNEFTLRQDGVLNQNVNGYVQEDLTEFSLGDTSFALGNEDELFAGDFAEVIIYDRALTDQEILVVERYLDCKWDITVRTDCDAEVTVYRQSAAGPTVGTTVTDLSWDTPVVQDVAMQLDANTIDFNLLEGGHYLVTYSAPFVSTGGTNRSEIQTWLRLNDTTDQVYGWGSSYMRRAQGDNDAHNEGAAILELAAGDQIRLQAQRSDNNTATVQQTANRSGINFLKLLDTWDYARVRASALQTITASWATVDLQTEDEMDSGTFTRSGSSITLAEAGHYLVTYNVSSVMTSNIRTNDEARLTLDGTEVNATRSQSYMRGSTSIRNATMSYAGIIQTALAGQVLELQVRYESNRSGNGHNTNIARTGLTIVKIPDSADYVRLDEIGGGQDITTAANTPITYDTTTEVVTTSFDHDGAGANPSRIIVQQDGDYLFFHSTYASRTDEANGPRDVPFLEWTLNGSATPFQYGGSGSQGRNFFNTTDKTSSVQSSSGFIAPSLSALDYIELTETNEANGGPATYTANRMGIQGVYIPSLFETAPLIRQLHFRWRDDSTALNTSGGFLAAEDVNVTGTLRNVTRRIRMSVANAGTAEDTVSRSYQLQWADSTLEGVANCAAATNWTNMASSSDSWEMVDSANITEGASVTPGILANTESYTYVAGDARDTADTTSVIAVLATSTYTELEFSIQPNDDAIVGHLYCFRLYDAQNSMILGQYNTYPTLQLLYGQVETIFGEAGSVAAPANGVTTTITYVGGPYDTPIVVGRTNSHSGNDALVFEATNVTATTADIRLCDSQAGNATGCAVSPSETIGYLVIDAAKISNLDGIDAGTFDVSGEIDTTSVNTSYSTSFATAPYVFTAAQSANGDTPIVSLIESSNAASFVGGICQQNSTDACNAAHPTETIGWVAIEPGVAPFGVLNDIGTGASISPSNLFTSVVFTTSFVSAPIVITQTVRGSGGQDVQIDEVQNVTNTGMDFRSCELDNDDDCDNHTSDSVRWFAVEDKSFSAIGNPNTAFDLTHVRWYEDNGTANPTVPLTNENASLTITIPTSTVRLRTLIQTGFNDLNTSTQAFSLQYAAGDTCATLASSTWINVGAVSATGTDWNFANTAATDQATLSTSLLYGGGHIAQTLQESNASVSNTKAIAVGARGEWDWAITGANAVPGQNYCFRVIQSDGNALLYTVYASASVSEYLSVNIEGFTGTQEVAFGRASFSSTYYGTPNGYGTSTEAEAHTIRIKTNARDGYIATIEGPTLTNGWGDTIDVIGNTSTAPVVGTEQFGIRVVLTTSTAGTATTTAPYNGSGWAYDAISAPDIIFSNPGGTATEDLFSLRYMLNIGPQTDAGHYSTDITYIITGTF